ncbi:small-conductance mechanosensitive channel [Deinococcus peraridilitoris DSM 19664]|uniref:Small-conductance mechanosensitive channel n=2 Tax=Deinococcus TaxID=1298 RepID=L0A5H7_DEIPD|nr:small-conductance mechanosensitive channel [Deinococcus peraridilitoris DSM 19664]
MPGLTVLAEQGRLAWALVQDIVPLWGARLLSTVVLALAFSLLYRLLRAGLRSLSKRVRAGPAWLHALDTALRLTCLTLFLITASSLYPLPSEISVTLLRVYLIILLLYFGWALLRSLLARASGHFALDASLALLTLNVARAVWIAVGLYLVFQQFGINLLPILGGLGIAGVALGFAAQDLLSNLISGITLLLDRPFTIGDWIRVGSWEGQVQRLTLRTTRLRTRDNEYISIPNSKVAGNDVVNLSAGGPLRVRSSLGVSYRADLDRGREVIMQVLQKEELVLSDPAPRVAVVELGESSVQLDLIYWIAQDSIARRPLIQQRVLEATKRTLDAAGIEIPFPQRVLHLENARVLQRSSPPDGEGEQPGR